MSPEDTKRVKDVTDALLPEQKEMLLLLSNQQLGEAICDYIIKHKLANGWSGGEYTIKGSDGKIAAWPVSAEAKLKGCK